MSIVDYETAVICGHCGNQIDRGTLNAGEAVYHGEKALHPKCVDGYASELGKIAVARWYPDGRMIPFTLELIPVAPHSLANAAAVGKYAECDTQKRTFETNPMECRECGRIDGVTRGWCSRCYVENKF